jgi:hypothetical protein
MGAFGNIPMEGRFVRIIKQAEPNTSGESTSCFSGKDSSAVCVQTL